MSKNIITQNNQPIFDLSIFEIVDGKVNLTKLAQSQNKDIREWNKLKSTKAFLSALEEGAGDSTHLKIIDGVGTFGTREVALKVAQWVSSKFEVFCIKQIDTLLQTGKVELSKPTSILDSSRAMANQMLVLIEQLELEQKENARKELVISTQRIREDHLITLKANEYKTIQTERKAELGREINLLVSKIYYEDAGADYKEAHSMGHRDYAQSTGKTYLGATKSSYESKLEYLHFLKNKNKNFLQKMLGM